MQTLTAAKSMGLWLICNFFIVSFTHSVTAQSLHNKVFYIKAQHSGKYLDVYKWSKDNGATIVQWGFHGGKNQQYKFVNAGSGYYFIQSVYSGKYLQVHGDSRNDNAKITQWSFTRKNHLQFKPYNAGGGFYYLMAKNSRKYVTVANAFPVDGTSVVQSRSIKGAHQKFRLEPIPTPTQQNLHNKVFYVKAKHSGKYWDVHKWSKQNGGQIVQWSFHGGQNQQFRFVSAGSGYYYIQSTFSKKYLQVQGGSKSNQAKIIQWAYMKKSHLQFQVMEAGAGYFFLRARHSGKYLDIHGAQKGNAVRLQQYAMNLNDAQRFKLEPYQVQKELTDCYTNPRVPNWQLVTEWDYDNKDWTDLCQGVTTDGHHWYFSSNREGDRAVYKYTHGMKLVAKAKLERFGSKHIGDLAYHKNAIYIALEQPPRMLMMTDDLRAGRLIEFHPASRPPLDQFPWVAVNPNNGYFYSSAYTNPKEVRYYEEKNNQLQLVGTVPLKKPINKVQGGDISPNCKLILSSDASNDIKCYHVDTGGYYGRMPIQKDARSNVAEEIEGLCISPGSDVISGKKMDIHLILLDQDWPDGDDVIFKHIAVPANVKF